MRVVRVGRPLVERVVAPTSLELPVRKGQRVGEVRVYDGRELLVTRPLVAARAVEAPGTASKVGWYAKQTLKNLGGLFSSPSRSTPRSTGRSPSRTSNSATATARARA
jgi:hypothetical protein